MSATLDVKELILSSTEAASDDRHGNETEVFLLLVVCTCLSVKTLAFTVKGKLDHFDTD